MAFGLTISLALAASIIFAIVVIERRERAEQDEFLADAALSEG